MHYLQLSAQLEALVAEFNDDWLDNLPDIEPPFGDDPEDFETPTLHELFDIVDGDNEVSFYSFPATDAAFRPLHTPPLEDHGVDADYSSSDEQEAPNNGQQEEGLLVLPNSSQYTPTTLNLECDETFDFSSSSEEDDGFDEDYASNCKVCKKTKKRTRDPDATCALCYMRKLAAETCSGE